MKLVKGTGAPESYRIEGMLYDQVPDYVIVKDQSTNKVVAIWNYEETALALFDQKGETLLRLDTPFPWNPEDLSADLSDWSIKSGESYSYYVKDPSIPDTGNNAIGVKGKTVTSDRNWGLSTVKEDKLVFIMRYKEGREVKLDGKIVNQVVASK